LRKPAESSGKPMPLGSLKASWKPPGRLHENLLAASWKHLGSQPARRLPPVQASWKPSSQAAWKPLASRTTHMAVHQADQRTRYTNLLGFRCSCAGGKITASENKLCYPPGRLRAQASRRTLPERPA
jgi:hypothetical protein